MLEEKILTVSVGVTRRSYLGRLENPHQWTFKKTCCGGICRDVLALFNPMSSWEMEQRPAEVPSKLG